MRQKWEKVERWNQLMWKPFFAIKVGKLETFKISNTIIMMNLLKEKTPILTIEIVCNKTDWGKGFIYPNDKIIVNWKAIRMRNWKV